MCTLTLVALVIYWSLESLIPEPFGLISAFLSLYFGGLWYLNW